MEELSWPVFAPVQKPDQAASQGGQDRQPGEGLQDGLGLHARQYHLAVPILLEMLAPPGVQGFFYALAPYEGVPVDIMVEVAGEISPGHQGALQQEFFERFKRSMVDQILARLARVSS